MPFVVIRPIVFALVVNQRAASGPTMRPTGPVFGLGSGNSVNLPVAEPSDLIAKALVEPDSVVWPGSNRDGKAGGKIAGAAGRVLNSGCRRDRILR